MKNKMRRRREGARERPLCFASNYYLAHLAQSAQISGSEFGSLQATAAERPTSHPSCRYDPGAEPITAAVRADGGGGR